MSGSSASGQAMPLGPPPGVGPADLVQGPIFVGFVVKVLLQGMIFVQGYIYYSRYPKDRLLIKAVVGFLILADTLNIVFNTMYLYDSFVTHYMDPLYLTKTNWLFATDPILNGLTACTAQLFFAWRIQILTKQTWIVILVALFAVASCCGAFGCAIGGLIVGSFDQFSKLKVVLVAWLAGSVFADVLIAVSLTWHLQTTGAYHWTPLLNTYAQVTLPTGLLQATVAVADLVLCFAIPPPRRESGVQFIFNYVLSKLFTNSVLSGLNARQGWRQDATIADAKSTVASSATHIGTPRVSMAAQSDRFSKFGHVHFSGNEENTPSHDRTSKFHSLEDRPPMAWGNAV
ncbi:hypothetical protein HGRIS_014038 [Hohenbuehelia grisea]|uniref:DUF6534 domain-containing protein n=1 Tax=Hohenbuehelia grisea TaxID=104357 RepID=A0ABR3JSE9_9AGAR